MSETFECPKCGYRWQQGQHGGHSCSDRLLQQLKDAKIELNSVLVDWNAIVSASGSKTHGGAVGHVAQMRAELEAVKSEMKRAEEFIEALKTQNLYDLRKAEEKGYLNGLKDFSHMECELESVKTDLEMCKNKLELAEEEIEALHLNLDDLELPRKISDELSMWGRVTYLLYERDALRARIEAAEKQKPVGWYVKCAGVTTILNARFLVGDVPDGYHPAYAMPPMPAQQYGKTAIIPMLNGVPEIIDGMKYQFIGEFSWKEEAPYYDYEGELHDYVATHVVPWDICKDIYTEMALFAIRTIPPMPAQQYKLPDNWEENIYDAMDEAFKLGKFADGGMQNDDTQIGVEFAVRHFKKMLGNKNG